MATIADLDAQCITRIADMCGPFGALGLRATCHRMRAMIKAPRHMTAKKLWRWAWRRGREDLMQAARDAGARDLLRYTGELLSFEIARELWTVRFATHYESYDFCHLFADDNEMRDMRAILSGSTTDLARICATIPLASGMIAHYLGKLAPDDMIRSLFDTLCARYKSEVHAPYALRTGNVLMHCCEIVGGVAKSGRYEMASKMVCDVMELDIPDVGLELLSNDCTGMLIMRFMTNEKCAELCKQVIRLTRARLPLNPRYIGLDERTMICEYLHEREANQNFNMPNMIAHAIECESTEMCDLARKWADELYASGVDDSFTLDQLHLASWASCRKLYPRGATRADRLLCVAEAACIYAAYCGSRKMCEYMRAWFKSLAVCACVCDPEETLRVLEHPRGTIGDCVQYIITASRITASKNKPREPPYSEMFYSAYQCNAYWILDLVYSWAHEDGMMCDLTPLLSSIAYRTAIEECVAITVVRARMCREARREIAARDCQ